jgi:hypothetical protein
MRAALADGTVKPFPFGGSGINVTNGCILKQSPNLSASQPIIGVTQ